MIDYDQTHRLFRDLVSAIGFCPESANPLFDVRDITAPNFRHLFDAYTLLNDALREIWTFDFAALMPDAIVTISHARDYIGAQLALELLAVGINGHDICLDLDVSIVSPG